MGTDAHVIVVGGPADLLEHARERIAHLEGLWSRFDPDSELSRLNRCAGAFMDVSTETSLLLERALDGWTMSAGAFDATLLDAVVAAGYDRTFEELPAVGQGEAALPQPPRPISARPDDAPIEVSAGRARLGEGLGVDSGGIGKGLAADLVVVELLGRGAAGACVNLGGDLRVAGESPDGDGWTIGVDHPWSPSPLALVGVAEGAVATSTTLRRRWLVGDEWRHHLIDPRSGLPSDSDLNHATVIAAEAWVAEVLAKAVLLNGSEFAFNIIGGTGAEALAVDNEGGVVATDGFSAYLGDAVLSASLPVPLAVGLPAR
jgi:thiamine biosynthesis lipoprotein